MEEQEMLRARELIRLLAQAVDVKGDYFPGHSDGVAYIVQMMATEGDFEPEFIQRLQVAAMLHDTGKLAVPDVILSAPRKLTEDEMEVVRQHPVWSGVVAQSIEGCQDLAAMVRHHHEHWDGSGYPDGLRGLDIPFGSRLLLVADAFHVMTNDRPYRRASTRSDAVIEIRNLAGIQFCPEAVHLLTDRADPAAFSYPTEFMNRLGR